MINRELGRVRQFVTEAAGMDVTYAYDDLAFVENSPFLIRFDNVDKRHVYCHFRQDCPSDSRERLFANLLSSALRNGMKLTLAGDFSMTCIDDNEEVEISFYEK
jgi:hypothetical protein